jgi:hypothetical protein
MIGERNVVWRMMKIVYFFSIFCSRIPVWAVPVVTADFVK